MATYPGTDFPNSGTGLQGQGTTVPNPAPELPFQPDMTTDAGAYAVARHIARKLVIATQQDAKTIDASIVSVSRRYRLGTFLESLWKGKRATITVSKFVRLKLAWNEVREARDRRAEQERMLAKHMEGFGL